MGLFGGNKKVSTPPRQEADPATAAASLEDKLGDVQQEATIADLMREKGQRRRVKVMQESALRGIIAEAVATCLADQQMGSDLNADKEALAAQVEQRLQQIMQRSQQLESQRQIVQKQHERLCTQLDQLARDHRGDADFIDVLFQWRQASQGLLDESDHQRQTIARLQDEVDRISAALRR